MNRDRRLRWREAALFCFMAASVLLQVVRAQQADDAGALGAFPRLEQSPVVFPGAPSNLLHVHITASTALQFYVDRASITVEPGQVVRYTLVARAPSGTDNVSYEGIDCARRRWKLYGVWNDANKTWQAASSADWQRIPDSGAQRVHATLYDDDFCKDWAVNGTAAQIAQRIQQGLRAIPY
jgi:hypothetical protein